MNYSRKQLEAFGEPLGESVTRLKPGGRIYGGGGSGGGGGPTSSTVVQSNIPDWLRPQVEQVLGGSANELFKYAPDKTQPITDSSGAPVLDANGQPTYKQAITGTKAFTPYSANPQDYVAGFSPLQQQVQANAANLQMPGQFNQATQLAGMAGQGGLNTANQAAGYGQAGFQSGMQGQQLGANAAQQAAYNAAMAQNNAYGYGAQGQQSGLMGQNLGVQGGQYYGNMGAGYGQQAAGLANRALNYGDLSSQIGQMGLQAQQTGQDITKQSQDLARQQAFAGEDYKTASTNPGAYQAYMSPFMQNVVAQQNEEAQRNADIERQSRNAAAVKAGAFGGSARTILDAEAARNLEKLKNQNVAQGLQNAYSQAQQNIQFGSNLGLQGMTNAQSGLNTALQGGQLGLAGIGTALQGQQGALSGVGQAGSMYGLGMQGANTGLAGLNAQLAGTAQGMQGAGMGLQGVGQAINAGQYGLQGAQTGMQGYGMGMQGAGMGLQGVGAQQAGYGLANQAGSNLANIGTQQLAGQQGILGFQNQIGGQQQAQQQQYINNAINNFAQAQQYPMQQYNAYNALLRGYAIPGQTATQYQAAPSLTSQLIGGGTAALAGAKLIGASGGQPKDFKKSTRRDGLDTLAMYNTMRSAA